MTHTHKTRTQSCSVCIYVNNYKYINTKYTCIQYYTLLTARLRMVSFFVQTSTKNNRGSSSISVPWRLRNASAAAWFFMGNPVDVPNRLPSQWLCFTLKATTLPFVIWLPDTPMRPGSSCPLQITDCIWYIQVMNSGEVVVWWLCA